MSEGSISSTRVSKIDTPRTERSVGHGDLVGDHHLDDQAPLSAGSLASTGSGNGNGEERFSCHSEEELASAASSTSPHHAPPIGASSSSDELAEEDAGQEPIDKVDSEQDPHEEDPEDQPRDEEDQVQESSCDEDSELPPEEGSELPPEEDPRLAQTLRNSVHQSENALVAHATADLDSPLRGACFLPHVTDAVTACDERSWKLNSLLSRALTNTQGRMLLVCGEAMESLVRDQRVKEMPLHHCWSFQVAETSVGRLELHLNTCFLDRKHRGTNTCVTTEVLAVLASAMNLALHHPHLSTHFQHLTPSALRLSVFFRIVFLHVRRRSLESLSCPTSMHQKGRS